MLQEVEDAMKNVDIFVDSETYYSEKNIKESLISTPKDQLQVKTTDFLILLKNLPNSVYGNLFNIDKEKDEILKEAFKATEYEEENQIMTIRMEGFKPYVHHTFFKSFQEAFNKKEPTGKKETKIILDYLMIPGDFSRTKFDGCLIVMKSVNESLIEIKLCGSSAILIIVFYLERVIKLFLRNCKKKTIWSSLYHCSPVHSSIDSTEDEESLPEVERKYGVPFSSTPAEAKLDDSLHVSSPSSSGGHEPAEATVDDSLHLGSPSSSGGHEPAEAILGDSQHLRSPSSSAGHENICVNCALIKSSRSISNLFLAEYKTEMSSCSTLCVDFNDSLETFIQAFCSKIIEKGFLNVTSFRNLKKNLKPFFCSSLDGLENGRLNFYCQMLEYIELLTSEEKDKVITFLNEIAELFVDVKAKEFETLLGGVHGKPARKALLRYMKETTNFLSLQAVVETMIIFHKKGIDIGVILPESLSFLTICFNNLPCDTNSIKYLNCISDITRRILINVLNESSIEVFELVEEEFMNEIIPAGRDLFLYLNKAENVLCHLVLFGPRTMYLERINLEAIIIDEDTGTVETDHWKWKLKSKQGLQKLMKLKNSSTSKENKQGEVPSCIEHGQTKDLEEDKHEVNQNVTTVEDSCMKVTIDEQNDSTDITLANEDLYGENEYDHEIEEDYENEEDHDNEEDDEEETLEAEVESGFKINQEDIKDYWDPARLFYRGATGRDWPMMYGSPCSVVMKYDRVKVVYSRNRNAAFAKLTGKCTICHSKHRFEVKYSPFNETRLPDGSIQYDAVKDMMVSVKVEGRFYVTDCKPDIKKPVHMRENAKGLDLRGEERRLLGIKASNEGASSVYKEGMAYLQRDQIENYNRTSARSLPVIR